MHETGHAGPPGASAVTTPQSTEDQRQATLIKTGALQTAIFNSANFSSIATDERGVIQIFNVGAERMLGYTALEVVNRITPADISDPLELVARAQALSAELATPITPGFEALVFKARRGIEDVYELTYLRKDGSRLPAVVSVTALQDAAESIIGYLLIGTDNTARQQVEAERKRLDEVLKSSLLELKTAKVTAEEANQAKSDFLSSMSHELRSPLNAILGFAQLVETGTPAPTAGQLDSIEQILQAGWYLLELINEILDLSLIESGKLSLSLEPLALAELLADCQSMIEPQAQKSGIQVHFPRLQGAWLIRADRTRLKQVLVNLLSNAIKYNRVGGRVDVSCTESALGRTRISVQDTGEGLAPEKLAQLFQSFNRLGQEGGAQEGTGIGLVVSKRLVELMGGHIGVDSIVGGGCTFWFELATAVAQAPPEPAELALLPSAPPLASDAAVRTLLCVEDNPANLLLVERLMARRPDVRLLSARDGRAGVELARAVRPDVILMDINLPGISGITALRILAEDPFTAHIPVIALSANAMPRDIEKGLRAGFFRYLTKPIKVGEFLDTLDLAFERAARPRAGASEVTPGDLFEPAKDTA
jgi:PAS domain S-box-containing protein